MLHYKLTGKDFTVKVSWAEVNVKEYISLMELPDTDPFGVLEILTSLERKDINRILVSDSIYDLLDAIEWFKEPPDFSGIARPDTLLIKGREIRIPKDIRMELYGQVKLFQQLVTKCKEEERNISTLVADAIAIFLFPQYMGKPLENEEELEKMKIDVYDIPILEAYPVADFFLTNYRRSLMRKIKPLKGSSRNRRRVQQALTRLMSTG